ncbi:MAG: NifU family protein [Phycisphaerales bacterium]|jgi:Fe-S cluster biogenesis protein NfuA|nr:NifU family protein [Phycisphaerales bacterium]
MVESKADQPSLTQRVEAVLAAVRPAIQADGGDVELAEITDSGEVRIRLLGACVECPSANLTLKVGIERTMLERVPEVSSVTAVD